MDLASTIKSVNEIRNIFILVAMAGLVFAIFALINNEEYIKIGLLTFTYGIIADRANITLWKLYCEPKNKLKPLFVLDSILMVIWIYFALCLLPM